MNESKSPEEMIAEWSKGMRLLLSVLLVILLFYSIRLVLVIPPSEKIFEDMLGDNSRLPADTKFVLKYWEAILGAMVGLNGIGILAIFTVRRPFQVCCLASFVLLLGLVNFHFIASAILSPLGHVIKGLSGGA